MESLRQQKFARLIQKELASFFQKNILGIQNTLITVSVVRMSSDLSVAKIYLSFFSTKGAQSDSELIHYIQEHHKKARHFLGLQIGKHVRAIPELYFYLDDSSSYASQIDQILSEIDIPPKDKDYKVDDDEE